MSTNDDTEPAVRKIQRTGGSTFTVSLPKEWALSQDLSAGTDVYLYTFEDRVVVAPAERQAAGRRVQVSVDDLDAETIGRDVKQAYATGADRIVVTAAGGLTADQRRVATDSLAGLVGLRVADETETCIEGRSVLDASSVSLEQTVAQLSQQVKEMIRQATAAVVAADADQGRSAARRKTEVDRLVALVARQFHAALVDVREVDQIPGNREGAYRHVRVARALQSVADAAARVGAVAADVVNPPDTEIGDALKECGDAIRALVRTALGDDRSAAATAATTARNTVRAVDDALARTDGDHRLGRIREALSMGVEAAAAIAALRLGHEPA